jgi:hypothetical protein
MDVAACAIGGNTFFLLIVGHFQVSLRLRSARGASHLGWSSNLVESRASRPVGPPQTRWRQTLSSVRRGAKLRSKEVEGPAGLVLPNNDEVGLAAPRPTAEEAHTGPWKPPLCVGQPSIPIVGMSGYFRYLLRPHIRARRPRNLANLQVGDIPSFVSPGSGHEFCTCSIRIAASHDACPR